VEQTAAPPEEISGESADSVEEIGEQAE